MASSVHRWLGVGFLTHGNLSSADLCIFDPDAKLLDYHLDDNQLLRLDESQDCPLLQKSDKGFMMSRRWVSCDPKDLAIQQGTVQFLAVASERPLVAGVSLQENGVVTEQAFARVIPPVMPQSEAHDIGLFSYDFVTAGVEVPGALTTLWCELQPIPDVLLQRVHHLVKLEPIIPDSPYDRLVHHVRLQKCDLLESAAFSGPCSDRHFVPEHVRRCQTVQAAWVLGTEAIVLPPEAGIRIGGRGTVHYNNPNLTTGIIDSSGLRLSFTPELRPFDAAMMAVGTHWSDSMMIPPGQLDFPLTGFCTPECTSAFPSTGIKIFGSLLHAHLTVTKIWTSIYRQGRLIGQLNRDDNYWPFWQRLSHFDPPLQILPGDTLATTCLHDTRDRTAPTYSGLGLDEEMCINYLLYYPAVDIESCRSEVHNASLYDFIEKRMPADANLSSPRTTAGDLAELHWSEDDIVALRELYASAPLNVHCLRETGVAVNEEHDWTNVELPSVTEASLDDPDRTHC
ncbi:unnamed protein product, partial [Mesorhabditis spiculigera]